MIGATATQPPVRILNPGGPVPRGVENFAEAVTGQYCLVDKSPFIHQILDCNDKIMLITRPRRFGKTMNMSMLQTFFERPCEGDKAANLFSEMLIQQAPDAILKQQGQYPVISLSFKDVKETCWQDAREHLCQLLRDEVSRQWPAGMDEACLRGLLPSQQEALRHVVDGKASDLQWRNSLWALCAGLTRQYGRPPLVLLDEYDTPLHAAYAHTKQEELEDGECYFNRMVQFMRGLLGTALKGKDTTFHKAVITGILRVARENIFSDLNNLGVYGVLRCEFGEFFGFTEAEAQDLLRRRGLAERGDDVRRWYNGYTIGGVTVYNPWSIVSFLASKTKHLEPYWVNTSGNGLIGRLLAHASADVKQNLSCLLQPGRSVARVRVETAVPLRNLVGVPDHLWSLLLTAGYATCAGEEEVPPKLLEHTRQREQFLPEEERGNLLWLRLPNLEIKSLYRTLIHHWFAQEPRKEQTMDMVKALLAGDAEDFTERLQGFVHASMSYFDVSEQDPERVYQAFVLGLLVQLEQDYHLRSERETGGGRADVLLIPKQPNKPGVILEFKRVRKADHDPLQQAAQAALQQIKDKNYAAEFAKRQCSFVLAVGIAFAGKSLVAAHERLG